MKITINPKRTSTMYFYGQMFLGFNGTIEDETRRYRFLFKIHDDGELLQLTPLDGTPKADDETRDRLRYALNEVAVEAFLRPFQDFKRSLMKDLRGQEFVIEECEPGQFQRDWYS